MTPEMLAVFFFAACLTTLIFAPIGVKIAISQLNKERELDRRLPK